MAYPDPHSRSAALGARARAVFPGGGTRGLTQLSPYPIYAREAHGCRVTDVDGVERIDFINNYTVQLFGHSHPAIVEAVVTQAERFMSLTLATESEIELGEADLRPGAVAPAHPLHQYWHRGGDARHQGCAGLHRAAQDRQVRGRLPRRLRLRRGEPGPGPAEAGAPTGHARWATPRPRPPGCCRMR